MILLTQFFAPYRNCVWVETRTRPGETADQIAARTVAEAMRLFCAHWPGLHRQEMHVTGISDGSRTLDSRGQPQGDVVPILAFGDAWRSKVRGVAE